MATVSERKLKQPDGTYKKAGWQVRWVDPDGKQRKKVFPPSKTANSDAKGFATSIDHQKRSGAYIDPNAGDVTFRDFAEDWLANQPYRASSRAQAKSVLGKHVYPAIGDVPLNRLRHTHIQTLVTEAGKTLAASSTKQVSVYALAVLNAAVQDGLLTKSPVGRLKVKTGAKRKVRPLERDQWEAFAGAMPERWRAAVYVGVGTGMRLGEVLGLTVDRVDFLRREIRVDRQMTVTAGNDPCLGPLKTDASPRVIPVPAEVLDEVTAHMKLFPPGPDGLLFTKPKGGALRPDSFSQDVARAATKVGLPPRERFHLLRHTYASMLIRGGCSVKVVQERLGHKSAQVTLNIYGHMWGDDDDRTRAAVRFGMAESPSDRPAEDAEGV